MLDTDGDGDLSVEEVAEGLGVSEKEAAKILSKAQKHWEKHGGKGPLNENRRKWLSQQQQAAAEAKAQAKASAGASAPGASPASPEEAEPEPESEVEAEPELEPSPP
eukprot:COSAG05_NODE_2273_length_3299_cov_11.055312_3_plen_107_part_00